MKKNTWLYLFKIIFTLSVFLLILYGFQQKLGGQQNLLEDIKKNFVSVDLKIFALALGIHLIIPFLSTFRLSLLTRVNHIEIGYWDLLKNIYIGLLFNPLLMGSTGGDIIRSYYLARQTGKKTQVVTMVFLDRFIGTYMIILICLGAVLFNIADPRFQSILIGDIFLLGILVFVTLLFFSRRIYNRFSFLKEYIRHAGLKNILKTIFATLHGTKKYQNTIWLTVLCTLVLQSMAIISCWLASRSMLAIPPIPLKYFFLFLPVIFAISAVPISIGGIGVGEAAYAALFVFVGINEANSISVSLLFRIVVIILALIGGFVYLLPSTEKVKLSEMTES